MTVGSFDTIIYKSGAEYSNFNSMKEGGRRCRGVATGLTPRVSIITVVYNGVKNLPSTIESVLSLKTDDVEYLVIDGGSTDGTVELLQHYEEHLDYWISQKDEGIYDAMNKGIRRARGDYVYHLNIGDILLRIPNALFNNQPLGTAGLAACVRVGDKGLHRPSTGLSLRMYNTLHHQGCFYRRKSDLHYDTRYLVFADFDLNQRLIKSGQHFELCDEIVALHDQGGISHNTKHFQEVFNIIKANHGVFWLSASFFYFKISGLLKWMRLI